MTDLDSGPKAAGAPPKPPWSPLPLGCGLGLVAGLVCFGYGLVAFFDRASIPYAMGFIVGGFVDVVACYFAARRDRAAWSFALSLNGVGTLLFLLGATRVRDGFDVHWGVSLIPAAVLLLVTTLLAMSAAELEEPAG